MMLTERDQLRAELLAAREVIDAMRDQNGSERMYAALVDYDKTREPKP